MCNHAMLHNLNYCQIRQHDVTLKLPDNQQR